MCRLGRRNRTRWIKLKKRQGFLYFNGSLWRKWLWKLKGTDAVGESTSGVMNFSLICNRGAST